jgi:hypothetical protein
MDHPLASAMLHVNELCLGTDLRLWRRWLLRRQSSGTKNPLPPASLMLSCFVYALTLKSRWNSNGPHSSTFQTTVPFKSCFRLLSYFSIPLSIKKIYPQKLTVTQLVTNFSRLAFYDTLIVSVCVPSSQLPHLYLDRFISVHAPTSDIFQFYVKSTGARGSVVFFFFS